MTQNNLAVAYGAVGRLHEATAILEPLLADRERILGAEHRDTLRTRNNLVGAYRAAGRDEEADAFEAAGPSQDARSTGIVCKGPL